MAEVFGRYHEVKAKISHIGFGKEWYDWFLIRSGP